ncbi:MAG: ADP-ribosylglycohydrolase family protein [Chloroflexi bacterium]|nr:ADP-ribosylglycohydrolase family protein [Chloroflexota bacterium]
MAGWDTLPNLIREEVNQRASEGCDVTGFAERVAAAGADEAHLMALYRELMALPIRPDFPFSEPSDLAAIRSQRPPTPRPPAASLMKGAWMDRFDGAWLGRCAGCALGKPLETGPYFHGADGRPGWLNVKLWFEGADAWPIRGYTPGRSRAAETHGLYVRCPNSQAEKIRFMESDDDIRYTVLGLAMVEERGFDFDAWDVGRLWHNRLTYRQVCTAETQAYLNFAHVTAHVQPTRPADPSASLAWVRTHLNPYREWIGAQIRVDGYAYAAAGRPELAAELAWRDASLSHVKNGIYGAMYVAALIAAAFVEHDVEKLIQIGLGQIPANCRLAHDVQRAAEMARRAADQVELVGQVWDAFNHYHPVHTNNNAALVTAALIFARGDFEQAIATAVLGGWDTDCNGATVGSIMGALLGASALPRRWIMPLNDTLYAEVMGFHPIAISECARRSYEAFRKLADG